MWHIYALLFILASVMNLVRARSATANKRTARLWLAPACVAWAACAEMFRFFGLTAAIAAGAVGVVLMVIASFAGRNRSVRA